MSDTGIQWTNKTWNPLAGCERVSPGCDNCYAFTTHDRRFAAWQKGNWPTAPKQYHRPFSASYRDQGVQLLPQRLRDPFGWSDPQMVFVNSMSDLFHASVPDTFIAQVFGVMALTPQHTYQVLTKRPERMLGWMAAMTATYEWPAYECVTAYTTDFRVQQYVGSVTFNRTFRRLARVYRGGVKQIPWPLPNVWLGTSVENAEAANERIPKLLQTPAAVRFLSCEPLLGPVDLEPYITGVNARCGRYGLHWVIVGGESGPRSRVMELDWARSLVRQCQSADVAVFVKQLGSVQAKALGLRHAHGGDWDEWTEERGLVDLRVREYPQVAAPETAPETAQEAAQEVTE